MIKNRKAKYVKSPTRERIKRGMWAVGIFKKKRTERLGPQRFGPTCQWMGEKCGCGQRTVAGSVLPGMSCGRELEKAAWNGVVEKLRFVLVVVRASDSGRREASATEDKIALLSLSLFYPRRLLLVSWLRPQQASGPSTPSTFKLWIIFISKLYNKLSCAVYSYVGPNYPNNSNRVKNYHVYILYYIQIYDVTRLI